MKKLTPYLFFCLFLFQDLSAALPPLYDSIAEYEALLNSEEFHETLGATQQIESIERIYQKDIFNSEEESITNSSDRIYKIKTQYLEIFAKVTSYPSPYLLGPSSKQVEIIKCAPVH